MSTTPTAIPKREAMLFWRYISSSIDQLLATLDGLEAHELNWSPLPTANSLYAIITHTLGNTAENVLEVLCGLPVHRLRDQEFAARGESRQALLEQWQSLRAQIREQLEQIDNERLGETRQHPRRGQLSGRDVLIVVARHCAEHMGQAFLTRDLILAHRNETRNETQNETRK